MTIAMTIVGGYLGAGKTTLVNRLLAESTEPVAVIVNDFGSINVDASLIESADDRTIALTNGCVCCSLTDGLVDALEVVKNLSPQPGRVVIETSGVADPATVAAYGDTPGFELDGVIVLADASLLAEQLEHHLVGPLVQSQLRAADLLVVNKVDLLADATLKDIADLIELHAPGVASLTATNAEVPGAVLLGGGVERSGSRVAPFEGLPNVDWKTWTNRANQPLTREQLAALVDSFPAGVVRGKGVVLLAEDPDIRWIFHLVGSRWTLEADGHWNQGEQEGGGDHTTVEGAAPVARTELVFIAARGL